VNVEYFAGCEMYSHVRTACMMFVSPPGHCSRTTRVRLVYKNNLWELLRSFKAFQTDVATILFGILADNLMQMSDSITGNINSVLYKVTSPREQNDLLIRIPSCSVRIF